ncbi:RIP metalloprotease RseP [uncultured Selenomonas sp.]|uniref:RIP metalloprotease RseP n=1 Tax=uncultured Selenomonas sp. TaxID=159275 RepID=UPI0028EACD20|nr:RIP metalloprotease RseP [uncultured Selenomonas sp.]
MVVTLLASIFVFGILVLVHEVGHFVAAKLTDMRVDRFAIGFGPRIVKYTHGETEYSLRALPLGGFNDIAGMDAANNTAGERGYCAKSIPARMIVILAGSFMNLILPIFLFFGIFFFAGVSTPSSEPVLGTVVPGHPAANAGLLAGDRIVAIEGAPVNSWQDITSLIKDADGKVLHVEYERAGEHRTVSVIPAYNAQEKRSLIGVSSSVTTRMPGFFEAAELAVTRTGTTLMMMLSMLGQMVTGAQQADLAGPIGVAQIAGEAAQIGVVPLLSLTALLSLNLAIINLFPIPALDGGHFLTLVVEAVRGKPLSAKAMHYAQMFGVSLLVLLMLYATKNDIMRIFVGG